MRFRLTTISTIILSAQIANPSDAAEGVVARCGASDGYTYYFRDDLMNPDGPNWSKDGISNGQFLLVKLGDEWDIQYGDTIGEYGYRQDGANVMPLGEANGKITIGAFRGTYTDIFTFDSIQKEVVWSSHKIGTVISKAGTYQADCSIVNLSPPNQ